MITTNKKILVTIIDIILIDVINRTIFSDINSREKFFLLCWLDRIRFVDSDVEVFFYESICLMERFLFLFFSVLSDILEHSCTFHSVKIFQSVLCLCKEERITCINLFLLFNLRFPFPGERNLSLSQILPYVRRFFYLTAL